MSKIRLAVAAIAVTGAMLLGIKQHEGYTDTAIIPVTTTQGADVPTIGYGSTYYADKTSVKLGDKITREAAEALLVKTVNDNYAKAMRSCIKVPLYPHEFTAYLSLTYNIGGTAFCNSTLVQKLNTKDYTGACREILRWDRFKGKPLKGLTKRRQVEFLQCTGK